jgi:hypothetical protein
MLLFTIIFILGQKSQSDFTILDADIYRSSDDGSIEALVDPAIPQPAVLNSFRTVKNFARLIVTNNTGLNNIAPESMLYKFPAISQIKENVHSNIKDDIFLKLRI